MAVCCDCSENAKVLAYVHVVIASMWAATRLAAKGKGAVRPAPFKFEFPTARDPFSSGRRYLPRPAPPLLPIMHVTPDSKPKRKGQSSLAIISPFSKTLLGTASHDADLLEGGLSKEVTDPKIVRCVYVRLCLCCCCVAALRREGTTRPARAVAETAGDMPCSLLRSVASTSSWTKCWVRKTDNVFQYGPLCAGKGQ